MNPLFQSLYDTVLVNTNRPNLREESKKAVINATRELHNRGRFRADVREAVLTSTNGSLTQHRFMIPSDRLVREILGVSPVSPNGLRGIPLQSLDIFSDGACSNSYSWVQGALTINLSAPCTTFSLLYLSFPQLDPLRYDSWIAIKYPHYITDLASYRVLSPIGLSKQAQAYRAAVGEARVPGSHIFDLLQENEEVA